MRKRNNGAIEGLVAPSREALTYTAPTMDAAQLAEDPDGVASVADVAYQWQREVEGLWSDIGGATMRSYTIDGVLGENYRVIVSYSDAQGYRERVVSAAAAAAPQDIYDEVDSEVEQGLRILYLPRVDVPRFSREENMYSTEVDSEMGELTIIARSDDGDIVIDGETLDGFSRDIPLQLGENIIVIKVIFGDTTEAQLTPQASPFEDILFFSSELRPQRQQEAMPTSRVYTLMTFRNYNVNLRGLSVSESQSFDATYSEELSFESPFNEELLARVDNETDRITVFADISAGATIQFASGATITTATAPVTDPDAIYKRQFGVEIPFGDSVVTMRITAPRATTKTYTLNVVRPRSSDATLATLNMIQSNDLSTVALSPIFGSATRRYDASVVNDSVAVRLSLRPTNRYVSGISVNGVSLSAEPGSTERDPIFGGRVPSVGNTLNVLGNNPITITVTAQDGSELSYVVNVNRVVSDDATLAGLSLRLFSGTTFRSADLNLMPSFDPATTTYDTDAVEHDIDGIIVVPSATDVFDANDPGSPGAVINVNGEIVESGNSNENIIKLAVGENTAAVSVTAEDGVTMRRYSVRVVRKGSDDVRLDSVRLIEINRDNNDQSDSVILLNSTPSANIGVPNNIDRVSFTVPSASYDAAEAGSPGADIKMYLQIEDGTTTDIATVLESNGSVRGAAVEIDDGATEKIDIVVRAEARLTAALTGDAAPSSTYTMVVTRAPNADTGVVLAVAPGAISAVTRTGSRADGGAIYGVTIGELTTSTIVTAMARHKYAILRVVADGTTSESARTVQQPLSIADTGESESVDIIVTAQSGDVSTHTLVVTRQDSSNIALKSADIDGTSVLGAINDGILVAVNENTEEFPLAVETADDDATVEIEVDGTRTGGATNRANATVALEETGIRKDVIIIVTAQNRTTMRSYTLRIQRAQSSDNRVRTVQVWYGEDGNLTKFFESKPRSRVVTNSVDVPSSTESVVVRITAQNKATIRVNIDNNGYDGFDRTVTETGILEYRVNLSRLIRGDDLSNNVRKNRTLLLYDVIAQNGSVVNNTAGRLDILRAPSADARLKSLTLSNVPAQNQPETEDGAVKDEPYRVDVANAVTEVAVSAEAQNEQARIEISVDDTVARSADGTLNYSLGFAADGNEINTTLTIVVTAQDGVTTQVYTAQVTRLRAVTDNALIDSVTLEPLAGEDRMRIVLDESVFMGTTSRLVAATEFADDVSRIRIRPRAQDGGATVSIDGAVGVLTGNLQPVERSLTLGIPKKITMKVVAGDGVTSTTYIVTVTRARSSDKSFTIAVSHDPSPGNVFTVESESTPPLNLLPPLSEFASQTTLTATVNHPAAVVRIDVDGVAAEESSRTVQKVISLNDTGGFADIAISVTAQDATTAAYMLRLQRDASSDNSISVSVTTGTLVKLSANAYRVDLANRTPSVDVSARINDRFASAGVVGGSGGVGTAIQTVKLAEGGSRQFMFYAVAQNGDRALYTVTVVRAASANNELKLSFDPPPLSRERTGTTVTVKISEFVDHTTMTIAATHPFATVQIGEDEETSLATIRRIDLDTGESANLKIRVTAQNTDTEDYTLLLSRQRSSDNALSDLRLIPITIADEPAAEVPLFDGDSADIVQTYRRMYEYEIAKIKLRAQAADSHATIKLLQPGDAVGEVLASGADSAEIALPEGQATTITIVVTAQNEEMRSYVVVVTRALNDDADLDTLIVESEGLSLAEAFSSTRTEYTAAGIARESSEIQLTVSTNDGKSISLTNEANGQAKNCLAFCDWTSNLAYGDNRISILVTAQNETTTQAYYVNAFRPYELRLQDLQLSGLVGSFTDFNREVGDQGAAFEVANGEDALVVIATIYPQSGVTLAVTAQTTAQDEIPSVPTARAKDEQSIAEFAEGDPRYVVPFYPGETRRIVVTVTAADGVTTNRYELTATRVVSDNAVLNNIQVIDADNTVLRDFGMNLITTITYTVVIPNVVGSEIDSVRLRATAEHPNVALVVRAADDAADIGGTLTDRIYTGNPIALDDGETKPIKIVVTAEDGETTRGYTVRLTRDQSADARLKSLTSAQGTVMPDPDDRLYRVVLPNDIASVVINMETEHKYAMLSVSEGDTVIGDDAISTRTITVAVDEGKVKELAVKVTAQNGTVANYTLKVFRRSAVGLAEIRGSDIQVRGAVSAPDTYKGSASPDVTTTTLILVASKDATDILGIDVDAESALSQPQQDNPPRLNAGDEFTTDPFAVSIGSEITITIRIGDAYVDETLADAALDDVPFVQNVYIVQVGQSSLFIRTRVFLEGPIRE